MMIEWGRHQDRLAWMGRFFIEVRALCVSSSSNSMSSLCTLFEYTYINLYASSHSSLVMVVQCSPWTVPISVYVIYFDCVSLDWWLLDHSDRLHHLNIEVWSLCLCLWVLTRTGDCQLHSVFSWPLAYDSTILEVQVWTHAWLFIQYVHVQMLLNWGLCSCEFLRRWNVGSFFAQDSSWWLHQDILRVTI